MLGDARHALLPVIAKPPSGTSCKPFVIWGQRLPLCSSRARGLLQPLADVFHISV